MLICEPIIYQKYFHKFHNKCMLNVTTYLFNFHVLIPCVFLVLSDGYKPCFNIQTISSLDHSMVVTVWPPVPVSSQLGCSSTNFCIEPSPERCSPKRTKLLSSLFYPSYSKCTVFRFNFDTPCDI